MVYLPNSCARLLLALTLCMGFCLHAELTAAPAAKYWQRKASKQKVTIPGDNEIAAMEEKLIEMINKERAKKGLDPLADWDFLSETAREHSQNMADGRTAFGHDGFESRAKKVKKQAKHIAFGENVAFCYLVKDPLKSAVDGWMNSQGHRENILGDYDETGMGIAFSQEGRCYFTQLFAKRR